MTAVKSLDVEKRDTTGKGAARTLRRDGKVPAIIYGVGEEEVKISIERKEFIKELSKGGFTSRILDLKIGNDTVRVLPRDIQFHPVTDQPEHADFLRVSKDSRINIWIRLEFHGREKCPGLKRGGILNIVRHEVELICSPDNIPESLHAKLHGLHIGDSIHIEEIELPEGVKPVISDRNFTLATIAGRAKEEVAVSSVAEDGIEGEASEGVEGEASPAEGGEGSSEDGESSENK